MADLILRVLTPDDTEMLFEHYRDLDPASKGCRFGIQVSDTALRQFLSQLDLNRDIHFAVVEKNTILALAQVSQYMGHNDHRLELGISVATNARRKGYASLLWTCATDHAIACNMREIYVLHSPRNNAMATFCRSKGLRLENDLGERVGIWTNPNMVDVPRDDDEAPKGWPGILPWPIPLDTDVPTSLTV